MEVRKHGSGAPRNSKDIYIVTQEVMALTEYVYARYRNECEEVHVADDSESLAAGSLMSPRRLDVVTFLLRATVQLHSQSSIIIREATLSYSG